MIAARGIEEELSDLETGNEHHSFDYSTTSVMFSSICNAHFRQVKRPNKYGVYVVCQKSTNQVLYIGKSGTINNQGAFSAQEIPGRLTNSKGSISSNEWFRSLVAEKGAVVVEYVFLNQTPMSPALAESILLQAYLQEYRRLPYRNSEF
jgi:hypothetical protein